jgi:protein SCO1/2
MAREVLVALAEGTSEAEFRSHLERLADRSDREPRLLELLEESAPVYRGRGSSSVLRMRAHLFATLERDGMPPSALPFVLAELENGREAYGVAGAARALRGLENAPAQATEYLLLGLRNIQQHDDAVTFGSATLGGSTSAVAEIVATLTHLGARVQPWRDRLLQLASQKDSPLPGAARAELQRLATSAEAPAADCCSMPSARIADSPGQRPLRLRHIAATDQEGRNLSLVHHLRGKVTIVAFFYTRCDNPNKCSLTVTRLARLQRELWLRNWHDDVQILGITYDPAYDSAALLKTYGVSRGFTFDAADRFLRIAREDWAAVRERFGLGVSYAGSIVTQHRVELYVLGPNTKRLASFARLRWSDDEVLSVVEQGLKRRLLPAWLHRTLGATGNVLLALAIALFPKCPLCWAAYLSLLGIAGSAVPYSPVVLPVLVALLALNLAILVRTARGRRPLLALGAVGAAGLIFGRALDSSALTYIGAALVTGSSLLTIASRTVNVMPEWARLW